MRGEILRRNFKLKNKKRIVCSLFLKLVICKNGTTKGGADICQINNELQLTKVRKTNLRLEDLVCKVEAYSSINM